MNLHLDHKKVIITGGTGGIGSAIVKEFLTEGAHPILFYRNSAKLEKLLKQLQDEDFNIEHIDSHQVNLTDSKQLSNTIQELIKKHSKIDVLVNCAGFVIEKPFLMHEEEEIDKLIAINFKSAVMLSKLVLRPMLKQKSGNIINISSASASTGGRGIVAYAATKAALNRFTQSLALEIGKKNIRVNAVSPGIIETDMSKNVRSILEKEIKNRTALMRFGKPNEISKMVAFLASESASSYITGQIFHVNGGLNI